jgi:ribosomal protein S18 acetylase RimI-like enzyme
VTIFRGTGCERSTFLKKRLAAALSRRFCSSTLAGAAFNLTKPFDGHRGWLYYLAVAPSHRHNSIGRALLTEAEHLLIALGCPKLNLLVRSSNVEVIAFYRRIGYAQDDVVALSRRLIHDAEI